MTWRFETGSFWSVDPAPTRRIYGPERRRRGETGSPRRCAGSAVGVTVLLVVLVLAFAIAGGFLGDLLEVAGWLLLILAVLGAVVGLAVHRAVKSVFGR